MSSPQPSSPPKSNTIFIIAAVGGALALCLVCSGAGVGVGWYAWPRGEAGTGKGKGGDGDKKPATESERLRREIVGRWKMVPHPNWPGTIFVYDFKADGTSTLQILNTKSDGATPKSPGKWSITDEAQPVLRLGDDEKTVRIIENTMTLKTFGEDSAAQQFRRQP